jgi:hypothetical protein
VNDHIYLQLEAPCVETAASVQRSDSRLLDNVHKPVAICTQALLNDLQGVASVVVDEDTCTAGTSLD